MERAITKSPVTRQDIVQYRARITRTNSVATPKSFTRAIIAKSPTLKQLCYIKDPNDPKKVKPRNARALTAAAGMLLIIRCSYHCIALPTSCVSVSASHLKPSRVSHKDSVCLHASKRVASQNAFMMTKSKRNTSLEDRYEKGRCEKGSHDLATLRLKHLSQVTEFHTPKEEFLH